MANVFKNNVVIIPWKYKELFIGSGQGEDILNDWGKEGWELVSINPVTMYAYLKKKV